MSHPLQAAELLVQAAVGALGVPAGRLQLPLVPQDALLLLAPLGPLLRHALPLPLPLLAQQLQLLDGLQKDLLS